jgi:predicted RNA methylase
MKNQQVNSKIRIEKEREQFYTSKSCVNHVMTLAIDFLVTRGVKIDKDTAFIEPSAGTGNFMIWLKEKGYKVAGYDLEPKMDGIIKQDFYKLSIKHDKKNIVIGNPPFGYKSKMALDFLNKSLEFSDIVIFILPMQFKRFLTQKNITPSGKLIFSSPKLEKNSFIFKDKPYNVNCIFQI